MYDMVGICETWQTAKDEFKDMLPGYTNFDSPRQVKHKYRGAGGVTVFVKNELIETGLLSRIYETYQENVFFLMEKDKSMLHTNVVFCFAYIAPENSPIYKENMSKGIEILGEKLTSIESDLNDVSFIIAGDLNSRVKDMFDFIEDDTIDIIFNDKIDYPSDTFCQPRKNRDTVCNKFGRSLIELCCVKHIHI